MSSREPTKIDDALLAAYLELEVTAEERSAVESALASSPATQTRLETLRGIRSVLSAPVPGLETDEAARNVMRAIARASRVPRAAKQWPLWGAGLAVAAAALFAIVRLPA